MSVIDMKTIASDSFGIDFQGTFRTACFGGQQLDSCAAPVVTNAMDLTNG
ncbi:MAG TPA: hypothetical protein PK513_07160 [Alphaproteobacteria bacterium]|nr:hypothetical protein [Alphaproteobacteria bacterium]USO04728.1 MAG: hypothetical protein H6859_06045 [Rhodospirillales bacterium]HOO82264.1 hypothetical protein [Alphaproteobacteria bacterium]